MSKSLRQVLEEHGLIGAAPSGEKVNAEMLPALHAAIQQLRPVLETFRAHDFAGVPCSRKLAIHAHTYKNSADPDECGQASTIRLLGKWLQPLGFLPGNHAHVIALKGLIIICPDEFSELPKDFIANNIALNRIIYHRKAI